jgi:branched-chain amino acid aminotransferase
MNGEVVMLERHIARIERGLQVLKIVERSANGLNFWSKQILTLCARNTCLENARIRLTVFRNGGGHYVPEERGMCYLIEANLNTIVFSDRETVGLSLGVFDEIKKPINELGKVKTANALIYVLAGIAREQYGMDDMIILNGEGRVAEAISSNIFLVKEGRIRTPSLEEGCVAGVAREWLIEKLKDKGILVEETKVSIEDVYAADEVFVSNAICGIRKVSRVGDTEFSFELVKGLLELKPEHE